MALVFALAGATLMYTGCTKDYGEDIDNLDAKLSSVQDQLSKQLADLQTEVSNLRSGVSSLESAVAALKTADEGFKTDISDLKTRVGKLEDQVKDLNKFATKDELKEAREALEKKITDEIAALKADILEVTDDLAKQIADLKEELKKKADAEDVEAKLKALEDAQAEVDAVYGFLSDELRSIVFLPDFYFAGIEATSYDFGSFIGYLVYGNPYADYTFYAQDGDEITVAPQTQAPEGAIKYVIKKGAKYLADLYYNTDAKGNAMWYKYDPDTYEWIYKDGKLVAGKEGDANVRRYFPANYLQGQVGKANYNLNPSSFPVDSAEWSLNGRNVKYVLKAEEEETWSPVFVGITSDGAGLATVEYAIDNPDKIYSSILGAVIDCAIGLYNKYAENEDAVEDIVDVFDLDELLGRNKLASNTNMNWMEQAQNELLAKSYRYNNVPTMQLVGTLGDGRQIVSDWHAISSSEEVVGHLAFNASNPYVTEWGDCGINLYQVEKDLYTSSKWAIIDPASVPVKWNGGAIDLAELIAIHTFDAMSYQALAEYTLAEFNEKYPGYHFEFEMVPYTIGANATSEDMYGKLDGSSFTPCYVESAGGKATSKPIAKDSEDGISAVGRQPVVLVTLVNDETKNIQAYGWFKLVISKDAKLPQFFEIPDLGKVPFICSTYQLATKWHEFSFFVLEALKVDYNQFINSYQFDGVFVYANVLQADGKTVKNELVATGVTTEGSFQDVTFQSYNKDKGKYEDKNWGKAQYKKDASGDGINDAFAWKVDPQKVGEGKTQSIYFKFHNGDSIVYFEMKADVAKKAKMSFAENKTNNLWFPDIDKEPMNTVRISVPVPDNTKGLTVMDFYKNLFEFFNGNPGKPVLGLVAEESDPIYASIYNNPYNTYRSELTTTTSKFQFSKTQPLIATAADLGYDTQLFVKSWKDDGKAEDYTKLYAVKYNFNWNKFAYDPVMDEISDGKGGYTYHYHIYDSQLIATITEGEEGGYVIEYADTDVAKYLLNLWSYKTDKQENMLYANITAKNKYGSTSCVSVDDGNFHVRFIRPIDIDFAAQDIAEESQVDGANVNIINFFEGITDWNNQPVIRKHMVDVLDEDGKVVKDKDGKPVQEWDGTYEEVVIKTINMYKYYEFDKIRINVGGALRNNWDSKDPSKWGVMAEQTPAHMLFLGSVDETTGKFTETSETPIVSPNPSANPPIYDKIYEVSIDDFNNLATYVLNYKNTQGYASKFTILVPIEIDYAWGTLSDYMVINIKETSETQPGQ
ncbi:MAG: hypothetical protein J5374_10815 [Bacteroidales bacterium]|nr:hypothetical protein [Bacteroidales bacterium]